jgi:hypothetical protein
VAPAATAKPLANVRREIFDGESPRILRVMKSSQCMRRPVDPIVRPQGYSGPAPVASAASIRLAVDTCTSGGGAGLMFPENWIAGGQFDEIYSPPAIKSESGPGSR